MRISDWSSDVCSSDLIWRRGGRQAWPECRRVPPPVVNFDPRNDTSLNDSPEGRHGFRWNAAGAGAPRRRGGGGDAEPAGVPERAVRGYQRSEEHTSELQSLMRTSYAVFCLKKKKKETPPNAIEP